MTEQEALYDHIGSKYDEYARMATGKQAECYTFFRMVGALEGKRILDLACGFGFYTRLLKQGGAAKVVGVDISPEMIQLANQQELADPLGITYQVGDATTLPKLGPFDLVTAVHLLTYATSKEQLLAMFRGVHDNLAPGGRFIIYTNNPAFTLSKANWTKHGITVLSLQPRDYGHACEAEFAADHPFRVRWFQWDRESYEWALREAGFRGFAWHPTEVAQEDIVRYGNAYWRDFYDNCLIIGLICQKPAEQVKIVVA